ncbi:hypothetical protein SAMN05192530_102648 [Aureimonas jatrophae]|uniref:Uncharacterized protein n=2 Tax=Aureimonas jatrophae TaxID=1166073 RepID=A0A1H0FRY9_9HYPH|nr:hypothetical protein SAMN05192530_102648 [Aureimonas jatrophae]
MAAGGAREGAGRPAGSRGKRTAELLEAMGDGLSPIQFMVEKLRDETATPEVRQWAAEKAAPYLHAKPAPEPRIVILDLPPADTAEGVKAALARIIEATASGEIAPAEAQSLVAIIEAQRKAIETADLGPRLAAIEEELNRNKGRGAS